MSVENPSPRPENASASAARGQLASRRRARARLLHLIFKIGVIAKGVDGAVELVVGLLFAVLSPASIKGIIFSLIQGELKEDPTDIVANLIRHNTATVIHSRASASAFLLLHGAVKLGLATGLATNRLWSYPAAIVVFTGFTIYQVCELAHGYSPFLASITVLDVTVVALVAMEYREVRWMSGPELRLAPYFRRPRAGAPENPALGRFSGWWAIGRLNKRLLIFRRATNKRIT